MKALLSAIFTMCLIAFLLIPLLLTGSPPIFTTLGIAMLSIIFNMLILGGINIKSLGASLGTFLSLLLAGILSYAIIHLASLNGISSQEGLICGSNILNWISKEFWISTMLIGALGAVMDIGMSIANCINEVKKITWRLWIQRTISLWDEYRQRYYRANDKYSYFRLYRHRYAPFALILWYALSKVYQFQFCNSRNFGSNNRKHCNHCLRTYYSFHFSLSNLQINCL